VRTPIVLAAGLLVLAGCRTPERPRAADAASAPAGLAADESAHLAHAHYTDAINSNNLDSLMGMMTEDVVFLAAHAPPMIGKAAVRSWAAAYYDAFTTRWEKDNKEFVVTGEWAFERYDYRSTDTPRAGGKPVTDTGWGLVLYHHDADGKWRVARDAFATDRPLPTN
jgi:ketosteroid isomerase-like protein